MNKAAQELGKLGGKVTMEKYSKDHFSKIAKGWPKGKKRKPACCGANSLFPGDVHDIDCPSPIKKVS